MLHILTCTTAAEMSYKLLSVYEQQSSTSVHLLQQCFFQFGYEKGSDMSTHLSKVQEMCHLLKQAEEELVEPSKQNLDDLVTGVLVEKERLRCGFGGRITEKTSSRKNLVIKGFKCGHPGHVVNQCRDDKDLQKCFGGASEHMTYERGLFTNLHRYQTDIL
ncbi:hypothetical protein PR048_001228 [Dryococelus australis]|uniref:CCHC-type domain-containing protein n=1 Tax=Dryococelus australis TaxID=614101 RepID=A0ABQ9IGS9_9NEOP|nr:hypothetical protein PR048_001228 [Dryococelus australis]